MKWLRPEFCVLATGMANDRLEHFALVERANNGSDHVHQFEVLPFHVASEQALSIRSEFKKPAVKLVSELSTDRPDRVERLSNKRGLFRRHDGNRRKQKFAREAVPGANPRNIHLTPRTARSRDVLAGHVQRKASPKAGRTL